jgi:outer membrane protein OmpA-like peptidoglycan-associated protein
MTPHQFRTTLLASTLGAAALTLGACATHEDVATAVGVETTRAQAAEAQLSDRVGAADAAAKDASARADAAMAAGKHPFTYSVLMQDDSVVFNTASAKLSDEAQKRLTEVAEKLKSEDRNVFIEIQGHGDVRGSQAYNQRLGERRAEAVRLFLAKQGVPLPRMTTVSYGEENPKNAEKDPAAHAENRRVVLVVMG